jgi:hypothetical protein
MMLRSFLTTVFAAVLALTSVTLVLGQHASAGVIQMVICTDMGAQTITLDANGSPIIASHNCPDCLAASVVPDLPPAFALPLPPLTAQDHVARADGVSCHSRSLPQAHARGPPLVDVI